FHTGRGATRAPPLRGFAARGPPAAGRARTCGFLLVLSPRAWRRRRRQVGGLDERPLSRERPRGDERRRELAHLARERTRRESGERVRGERLRRLAALAAERDEHVLGAGEHVLA